MFLQHLDENQKRTFFALAIRMILTDGIIKPEEISYLNQLIEDSGIPGDVSLVQSVETPDLSIYKTRSSRMVVATELMIIATVDKSVHDLESAMFKALVTEFHLNDNDLKKIRLFAVDCAKVFSQGCELIAC